MNRTFKEENLYYTPESFFLAVITAVGPLTTECANWPCSWRQYPFCNNGANPLPEVKQAILSGDYTKKENTAYPIDFNNQPFVGQQVLMRFRMLDEDGNNVYEFIAHGGTSEGDSSCFVVKSVQCSNNILQVISSNAGGCLNCTGGIVSYTYNTAIEIPTNTPFLLPDNWVQSYGDPATTGLTQNGAVWENTSGGVLTVKLTYQGYFTPQGVGATQSRWIFISKNGSLTDLPVASFISSNQTYIATVATNTITLGAGDTIQCGAFQDGGAGIFIGGVQRVPTQFTIEKLCL